MATIRKAKFLQVFAVKLYIETNVNFILQHQNTLFPHINGQYLPKKVASRQYSAVQHDPSNSTLVELVLDLQVICMLSDSLSET